MHRNRPLLVSELRCQSHRNSAPSPSESTQQANDEHYLDHHLQQVAGQIENDGDIELAALGVGLDLSPYYRRSHVLDLQHGVTDRLLREVVLLLATHGSHQGR